MKRFALFVFATVLLSACTSKQQEEIGTPFKKGENVTLSAVIPDADANRLPGRKNISAYATGMKLDLSWDTDDQILVKVGDKAAAFTLKEGAGTTNASFVGEMPANGTEYGVQYPAEEPNLAEQVYKPNGFCKGLMKMTTRINGTIDNGFELKADNSVLGLQLIGSMAIGKIVLTKPNELTQYSLDCSGGVLLDSSTPTVFYFVLPAGTWDDGFIVDVYNSDKTTSIKTLIKNTSITFNAGESILMPVQCIESDSKGTPVFSVGNGKKVTFSLGNLQYTRSTKSWSFAEKQYDIIGTDNVKGGSVKYDETSGYTKEGTALADKIDLFGWSSNSNKAPFGVSTSLADSDYLGNFVDWGTNRISGYDPDTWRTMTLDEARHLLGRHTSENCYYGMACVASVNGMIVLPDNWVCPSGITVKLGAASTMPNVGVKYYAEYQNFDAEQWSRLEAAGAVFLPAAGSRGQFKVLTVQSLGSYWTTNDDPYLVFFSFGIGEGSVAGDKKSVAVGHAVRLVKDL